MNESGLAQFMRLLDDLLTGNLQRSKFQAWEIEILLDIESCDLPGPVKHQALREYQDAVRAQMEKGADRPLKFSEYLNLRQATPSARKPAAVDPGAAVKPKTKIH
jgi:hypothetical protein